MFHPAPLTENLLSLDNRKFISNSLSLLSLLMAPSALSFTWLPVGYLNSPVITYHQCRQDLNSFILTHCHFWHYIDNILIWRGCLSMLSRKSCTYQHIYSSDDRPLYYIRARDQPLLSSFMAWPFLRPKNSSSCKMSTLHIQIYHYTMEDTKLIRSFELLEVTHSEFFHSTWAYSMLMHTHWGEPQQAMLWYLDHQAIV